MKHAIFFKLLRDNRGGAITEFALLAPVILTLMFGIFHVALYMQNYNAVRSVASDIGRYVMVEYQKGNNLSETEIRSVALSMATGPRYILKTDQLEINVNRSTASRVTGAMEFGINITYNMEDLIPFVTLPNFQIAYSRPVFVAIIPT